MSKSMDDIVNQMLDPEQFTLESIKYQQTLILQQMRIDRIAASCLGGSPYDQRYKINELYGAVYNLVTNLKTTAKDDYLKRVKPFMKINVWDKRFSKKENLISFFQHIMSIHELNIKEFSKYGLKPAKKKALWMATSDDIKKDVKESWKELGVIDDKA